jgi:O-antigen/teichoic acid export membrane protein
MEGPVILIPIFGILAGMVAFVAFCSIFILPAYFKSRERQRLQDTLRFAIENGQSLPSDVVEALTSDIKRVPSQARDFRRGVIWLALAGALITIGVVNGFKDGWYDAYGWFGTAAIPGFIGLAFLAFGMMNKSKAR